jgi:5-deoxy-glucuronate isomerase
VHPDTNFDFVMRAVPIPPGESGVMLSFTPEEAGWETLGFTARRLVPGDIYRAATADHEAILVVLGGKLTLNWGDGPRSMGERENVFAGYPHSAYLPCGLSYEVRAETVVEFAETRVLSRKQLQPRLIPPADVRTEIRGSGNATRQILRILRPEAEADKLMANEVYTPDGNWSSYPPHKHDTLDLPRECDLDEIYYFRVNHPDGFAFLRVYDSDGKHDSTALIRDGDLGVLRGGYHLVAAPPGYQVYYLAVLAGAARNLAASTDPSYDRLKSISSKPDPRVPFIQSN